MPNGILLRKPLRDLDVILAKSLYKSFSKHQFIEVMETPNFGKMLILDGVIQLATYDEFIYHEALVHPAIVTATDLQNVLILGGGDGGALREVLKWESVKRVTLVDLDPMVIDVCQKYLSEVCLNSFNDKRVELCMGEGRSYVANIKKEFDLIVIDVTCATAGSSQRLYTLEFYQTIKEVLSEDGVFVTHSESIDSDQFLAIVKTVSEVFPIYRPYKTHIPSFGTTLGFTIGSTYRDPLQLKLPDIEKYLIRNKIRTRFYEPSQHVKMFSFPKEIQDNLKRIKAIKPIRDNSPLSEQKRIERGERWFTVNDTGYSIWQLCNGKHTVEDIVEQVCRVFDIDSKIAKDDLVQFILKLGQEKLIKL